MEGNDENLEDPTSMGKQRFFSKFTLNELKVLFSQYFSFVEIQKIEVKMNQIFFILVFKIAEKIVLTFLYIVVLSRFRSLP